MSQVLGIVAAISSNMTARKVAYIRGLHSDIEVQTDLWRKEYAECVGAFLKESTALARWAEKRLKKMEKEEAAKQEKERKAQVRARRNGTQPRSQEEVKASIEKAKKEKAALEKTKGRGFKPLKKDAKKQQLLEEARKLRAILAEKARKEREEQRAKEEAARREQDRLKTEAHKLALLKAKQERDLWARREAERQEKLVQKHGRVFETTRLVLPKKVDQEVVNLEREISRYKKELGLQ